MAAKKDPPGRRPRLLGFPDQREALRAHLAEIHAKRSMEGDYLNNRREMLLACQKSFHAFLRFWQFRNRDTGETQSFEKLWHGQRLLVAAMEYDFDYLEQHELPDLGEDDVGLINSLRAKQEAYPRGPWLFELKAGKLGFSELACAYDAWVALFRSQNARVHIFSRDLKAAQEMLRIVKFGLQKLPGWFGVRIPKGEADSDTTTSLRLIKGADDQRIIKSYATGENISIDMVAQHVHLDEWAHMKRKKEIWEDVQTTVAPKNTLHIVTRGAGEDEDVQEMWDAAKKGNHDLVAFFAPWNWRDDRDDAWYEREENKNTTVGLAHFAPNTPEAALMGDMDNEYISAGMWAACYDPGLPEIAPGLQGEPMVLSLDAAVSGDCFAAVAASRHPDACDCGRTALDPAIRAVKVWRPADFPGHEIDFDVVEGWIRVVHQGGCPGDIANGIEAHPRYPAARGIPEIWNQRADCGLCQAGVTVEPFNIVQATYDPFQLEGTIRRLNNDGVLQGIHRFQQMKERTIADQGLLNLAQTKRLAHNGDPVLAEHVRNARAQVQPREDSKIRIVKKGDKSRIDATVAASMAVDRVLRLHLT